MCWTFTGSEVNTIRYGKLVLSLWQSKPFSARLEKGSLPSPIAMFPRQSGSGMVGHCCPGLLAFGKPLLFSVLEVRFLGSQRTAVPKAGRPQLGIQLMCGEITMIELMRQFRLLPNLESFPWVLGLMKSKMPLHGVVLRLQDRNKLCSTCGGMSSHQPLTSWLVEFLRNLVRPGAPKDASRHSPRWAQAVAALQMPNNNNSNNNKCCTRRSVLVSFPMLISLGKQNARAEGPPNLMVVGRTLR